MSAERDRTKTAQRKHNETPLAYRNRLARELGQRSRIKNDGEDFNTWVDRYGEKGVLTAYLGWQGRYGTNLSSDFQGTDLLEASAIIDENEGANAFENALQKARGKEVNMRGILRYIDRTLRELEHNGVNIKLKNEFKEWCIRIMEDARNIGPLAEELKSTG